MEGREANVLSRIAAQFPDVDTSAAAVATRRVFLMVPEKRFMEVLAFLAEELGYTHLLTITGLDTGEHFELIYHTSSREGILFSLKYQTGRDDPVVIPSVLPIYNGATFYERELEGLLGVKVEGLPEGRQYPLPDNWPEGEYPMRKEWKPKAAGVPETAKAEAGKAQTAKAEANQAEKEG